MLLSGKPDSYIHNYDREEIRIAVVYADTLIGMHEAILVSYQKLLYQISVAWSAMVVRCQMPYIHQTTQGVFFLQQTEVLQTT